MDQVDLEVEHIARAFFAAWHGTEAWENASRSLKHEFRLYARQAISMLEKRQEQVQRVELDASPIRILEIA
ncbi:hypothetical protein [Microvirga arabica]|uniref:Uncharacterized protein n=1 Tax=Microvirga arabica TaxID=1128671 RepID=A0ABV6YEY5_9HYPH|nr:hypothetical protein [Microvirga arabica]MBM1170434.1 hypothetical protein [Microvirga arabica]